MNFKSVTINLLLTTLSGGVLLQTLEAQAASITFGAWDFNPATVTTNSSFATGNGNATPMTLKALAQATATDDPLSWGDQTVRTIVSLSNFFIVTPETGEKNGDKVKVFLSGRLEGIAGGRREVETFRTDSFLNNVNARVDVRGFQSFIHNSIHGGGDVGVGVGNMVDLVFDPFEREAILTIGEAYGFNMSLGVTASKTGFYEAFSNFGGDGRGLTLNVRAEPVPEPLTMLASATALGFGAFFKREHSKKPKKS